MGAGLAFRGDDQLANPFLAIPGLLIFLYGIVVAWVRAAGREWDEVERRRSRRHMPHADDQPAH